MSAFDLHSGLLHIMQRSIRPAPRLRALASLCVQAWRFVGSLLYTAILFTWTDYKTIFLPVLVFASGTAPVRSLAAFGECCFWVWCHLLLCNVSNQARSKDEDAVNRPWRPLPAGRVSVAQAGYLRKAVAVGCLALSLTRGPILALVSAMLLATTILYDECGLSAHPAGKNFCNIFGYNTFQTGAIILLNNTSILDRISLVAIVLSGLTIFTTIQMQDFPDVAGDAAIGRITFPIYAPELSRWATFAAMLGWSLFLGWFWDVGMWERLAVLGLGAWVGLRCFYLRSPESDTVTYRLYNVWLMTTFLLPSNARRTISL